MKPSQALRTILGLAALGGVFGCVPNAAQAGDDAADYAFTQKPGVVLPLAARLREADGRAVRLGDLMAGRPVILALGYYHCPNLCGVARDDLLQALAHSGLQTPIDYNLVALSIDPAETSQDAATALADDRERYPTPGADAGWHFLTGDAQTVASVADAVGFHSRYDEHLRQFLHPAGIVVTTGEGIVSGYVLGVGYGAGDVRAAVTLASANGIAKAALPVLLLCFHYDAATGRYSLAVMNVLRLGAFVTVMVIAATLVIAWRRGRRPRPVGS